jgi:hypothetical protein
MKMDFTMFTKHHTFLLQLVAMLTWCLSTSFGIANDLDSEPANYAFASYMGSGLYSASGREVRVFNIPFSYQPEGQQGETIMSWRLPVSMGFFNFDFDEVLDGKLPKEADTLTFIPGVQWHVPISKTLFFAPYVDLGWGVNYNNGEEVIIYSSGIASHYKFGEESRHQWVNRLLYAGYKGLASDITDRFASLQIGVDVKLPLEFSLLGRPGFISAYSLAQWHFNALEFAIPEQQSDTIKNNFELGLTLGVHQAFDFKYFDLERIGLGYRGGENLKAWRITFNLPI